MNAAMIRERFDKWAESEGYSVARSTINKEQYFDVMTMRVWRAYQAAASHAGGDVDAVRDAALEEAAKVCHEVMMRWHEHAGNAPPMQHGRAIVMDGKSMGAEECERKLRALKSAAAIRAGGDKP